MFIKKYVCLYMSLCMSFLKYQVAFLCRLPKLNEKTYVCYTKTFGQFFSLYNLLILIDFIDTFPKGVLYHKGQSRKYSSKFGQGSIVGVHLDMWLGRLSFYKNRKPLGRFKIFVLITHRHMTGILVTCTYKKLTDML